MPQRDIGGTNPSDAADSAPADPTSGRKEYNYFPRFAVGARLDRGPRFSVGNMMHFVLPTSLTSPIEQRSYAPRVDIRQTEFFAYTDANSAALSSMVDIEKHTSHVHSTMKLRNQFTVRITGSTQEGLGDDIRWAHSWYEVKWDGINKEYVMLPGGRNSDTNGSPAYHRESEGRETLTEERVVWLIAEYDHQGNMVATFSVSGGAVTVYKGIIIYANGTVNADYNIQISGTGTILYDVTPIRWILSAAISWNAAQIGDPCLILYDDDLVPHTYVLDEYVQTRECNPTPPAQLTPPDQASTALIFLRQLAMNQMNVSALGVE
jgi:hypothetical protein